MPTSAPLDKVDRNCERLVALADDLGAIAQTDAGPLDLNLRGDGHA